jgi:23S rRNA pseudouridine2605 synthase
VLRNVSLARALSKLGAASRTEAEALVRAGRVRVNGRAARSPALRVDPARDRIELDGAPVRRAAAVWLMLHKPAGRVTTRRDPDGRPTVYDLLPPEASHVGPVGRLDADTTGLLLFTNETRTAAALLAPGAHVEKTYLARLDGPVGADDLERLRSGVALAGRTTRPSRWEALGPRDVRITLREGLNRQIHRMLWTVGRRVERLHRVSFGPLALGGLASGRCRPLEAREVAALRRAAAAGRRVESRP